MASGHVNRIKRPNTWLQRPMLQNREESSCQTGAVHTWHIASLRCYAAIRRLSRHSGLWRGVGPADLWGHGLVLRDLAEQLVEPDVDLAGRPDVTDFKAVRCKAIFHQPALLDADHFLH